MSDQTGKRTWVEARSHVAILDDSAHTDVQGTSSVFVETTVQVVVD